MQWAAAREVREQVLHLVREHATTLQVDVFRVRRRERHGHELEPRFFRRDANVCMYCGQQFRVGELTRDHITPISRGGRDVWTNVVTACRRCNNHKGGRTPEEARLQLVAVPFTPTYAEYIYLKGRRVLADQMQYLLTHFPRSSPLHARLTDALAEVNRGRA